MRPPPSRPPRAAPPARHAHRPVPAPRPPRPPRAAPPDLDALDDDGLADLLDGAPLSPEAADALQRKIRARQDAKRASIEARHGPGLTIELAGDVNPFAVWLWFEFADPVTPDDVDLLDGVITAWFLLGRLGGFNSSNLQLSQGDGIAAKTYDAARLPSASSAVFHDCSDLETRGAWARCKVNLGTADEMAVDVLANAVGTLARENTRSLKRLVIGGAPVQGWAPPAEEAWGGVGGGGGGGVGVGPLPGEY